MAQNKTLGIANAAADIGMAIPGAAPYAAGLKGALSIGDALGLFGDSAAEQDKQRVQAIELAAGDKRAQAPRLLKDGGFMPDNILFQSLFENIYKIKLKDGGEVPETVFEGNTHNNGGIALGNTGIEVEKGEVQVKVGDNKKFVLSNNLTVDKDDVEKYNLPKSTIGKTIADVYKTVMNKTDLRENDNLSNEYKDSMRDKLVDMNRNKLFNTNMENFKKDGNLFNDFLSNAIKAQNGIEYDPYGIKHKPPTTVEEGELRTNQLPLLESKGLTLADPTKLNNTPIQQNNIPVSNILGSDVKYQPNTTEQIENMFKADVPTQMQSKGFEASGMKLADPTKLTGSIPTPQSNIPVDKEIGSNKGTKFNVLENIGGILGAGAGLLGTLFSEKEELGRVSAPPVSLEKVNPTQAVKSAESSFRGAGQDLRNSGVSLSTYLSNRAGLASQEASTVGNIYNEFAKQNVGISNQQAMTNADIARGTSAANQQIYAQEQDLNDRNKAQALNMFQQGVSNIGTNIGTANRDARKEEAQQDLIKQGWIGNSQYTAYQSKLAGGNIPMRIGSDGNMYSNYIPLLGGRIVVDSTGKETVIK